MKILNTKRRWIATIALGAIFGGTTMVLLNARHEPLLPRVIAAPQPLLHRVKLEGDDVARLLQLNAYKWNYTLPASGSQRVSLALWVEDWGRKSAQPQITGLGNIGLFGSGDAKGNRTLAVKLPRAKDREFVVNTESSAFVAPLPQSLNLSRAHSISAAEREPVAFNRDVILVAATQNASGTYSSDYKSPNFTRRHDRTVFIKARFIQQANGNDSGSPVWKGGKIVFE